MKTSNESTGLSAHELEMMAGVFRRHPEVCLVKLFGSRAKGTHSVRSDVDLAVWGTAEALQAEAIAGELDELPLPYRVEVQSFEHIANQALREYIQRVGIALVSETSLPTS